MNTTDFYTELATVRGLRGDTFPVFRIHVTGLTELNKCSMRLILEQKSHPGSIALIKAGESFSDDSGSGFCFHLTSNDTAVLCGVYSMYFILTDSVGMNYIKLTGTLEVLDAPPQEVT